MLEAHGEFPEVVYRVYDSLEYAEKFIAGNCRFGNIKYYKTIEDEDRRDVTEGEAQVSFNGVMRHSSFCTTSFFILSFYRTIESALASKKGEYIVEVTSPRYLAEKISTSLEQLEYKFFGGVEGVNIEYTYADKKIIKPNSIELARLTYAQKPIKFSNDEEFRLVIIREACNDKLFEFQIDDISNKSKIIK